MLTLKCDVDLQMNGEISLHFHVKYSIKSYFLDPLEIYKLTVKNNLMVLTIMTQFILHLHLTNVK